MADAPRQRREPRRRTSSAVAALTLATLTGCGAGLGGLPVMPRRAGDCAEATAKAGHVQVYLERVTDTGSLPLCPGDHLQPQEPLDVVVEVVRPAHVHLMYVDADGNSGAAEPAEGTGATRRAVYHLPPGLLTAYGGRAELLVLVSLKPLEEADTAMFLVWRTIAQTGAFVSADGQLRPGHAPAAAARPVGFDGTAEVHARFDAHGVAALTLSLD